MRALTLPDLPRLMPSAFISRAVATIGARAAPANQARGTPPLGIERVQPMSIGRYHRAR